MFTLKSKTVQKTPFFFYSSSAQNCVACATGPIADVHIGPGTLSGLEQSGNTQCPAQWLGTIREQTLSALRRSLPWKIQCSITKYPRTHCAGTFSALEHPFFWNTLCTGTPIFLEHPVHWNTQIPGKLSALEHPVPWNTHLPETPCALEHPFPWNTQCPGTPISLEHPVHWNTHFHGTLSALKHSTLEHSVPWNTRCPGTLSLLEHSVPWNWQGTMLTMDCVLSCVGVSRQ